MATITDMVKVIAASLWIQPATYEELVERFSGKYSEYSIYLMFRGALAKKWIYQKGETYYTYKKTVVEILNPDGYALDLPELPK